MNITVRPFKPGEEEFVAELHRQIYSDEYSWGPAFLDYAVAVAKDFAAKQPSPREELFIAEAEGTPAGCIMLCETDDAAVGQLRLFAVDNAFRKHGIGRALTSALMEKARQAGYRSILLWTASPLTSAIRHYEKLGFRITEEVPNTSWSTDGSLIQEIKMEMQL